MREAVDSEDDVACDSQEAFVYREIHKDIVVRGAKLKQIFITLASLVDRPKNRITVYATIHLKKNLER